ncbi:MAG TPA: hypothetical protein DCG57_00485, partial [Candidatus Riflebacteria bacterium]|nr:hypothetical protein [Candidatus Riflebacteria bacterium]
MKLNKCFFVSIVASFFLLFLITGCQNPFYGDFKADESVLSSLAADNPLLKAQIGDWIKLKCSYLLNGTQIEEFIRKEVVKKDETTVTMKTSSTFSSNSMDAYEGEEVVALNSWDELL